MGASPRVVASELSAGLVRCDTFPRVPALRRLFPPLAAALVLAALLPAVAPAQSSGLKVTLVARVCDTYQDIMANRARNDIQESLENLGKDTVYSAREPVTPDLEEPNNNCNTLNGWRFKLGTDYRSKAVVGPWGALSIVENPYAGEPGPTRNGVPLLGSDGVQVGNETIDGAVTIDLTQDQADRAARDNSLWIQGGVPADPVLNNDYPNQYGFGALRCAVDNLNGDNVEWIAYPSGAAHVFCYAYYVKPPPTAGAIIVRKEVDAPAGTAAQDFRFAGNLSYNEDGKFTLRAAPGSVGSQTFFRAAGGTWTIDEEVPPGWALDNLTCSSLSGQSGITTAAALATITLAARDTVTCTYRDRLLPPPSGLTLGKVTLGRTGTADFSLAGASEATGSVTTSEPGVVATTAFDPIPAGDYTVTERPVDVPGGRWRREEVRCNGAIVPGAPDPLPLTLVPGGGASCIFYNRFVPDGTIKLRKRTFFRTGTTGFVVTRAGSVPPEVFGQSATTTQAGEPVLATGDSTERLPLGTYDIQELTTSNADGGSWELDQVVCNGQPFGSAQGRVRVVLTEERPDIDCTFSNRFRERAPDSGVLPGTDSSQGADPVTDLVIRKTATPKRILAGEAVRYKVTVINRSDVVAEDVSGSESRPPSGTRVQVSGPKRVKCRSLRPIVCSVGDMAPHSRITLTATVRTPRVGRVVNRVAVHTATREDRLGDNRAKAVVHVRRLPRFTG